jgi:tryptophan synthase beta chain
VPAHTPHGKPRRDRRDGAGQHGVATAAAAARFGLECTVYMGTEDARRQHLNVQRMKLLGAELREVDSGSRTLKDAINEALRDWVTRVRDTHYVLGLGARPAIRSRCSSATSIASSATRPDVSSRSRREGCPTCWSRAWAAAATRSVCSTRFLDEPNVRKVGVEAGGHGSRAGDMPRGLAEPSVGVLHGTRTLVLQDATG